MLEAAAGEQDRQVGVVVGVGVAHVAAEEHHRPVQQTLVPFAVFGEPAEDFGEQRHLLLVGVLELADFFDGLAVVA